jgi:predicted Zn-dependent peptidase
MEASEALASILGGSNSRFFWNIVQEGLAPVAGAWRAEYGDAALLVLYGFCEPHRTEALSEAIRREAERITRHGVTEDEVRRVRNRRRTGLVVEAESPYHRLTQLADDIDTFDRPRNVAERMARVERLRPADLTAYLERWPITGDGFLVSVGPRRWPP